MNPHTKKSDRELDHEIKKGLADLNVLISEPYHRKRAKAWQILLDKLELLQGEIDKRNKK